MLLQPASSYFFATAKVIMQNVLENENIDSLQKCAFTLFHSVEVVVVGRQCPVSVLKACF
jgi:hypothetical protein